MKCFTLGVMRLLALDVPNLACTVIHNVDILHCTFVAVRTHCCSLPTAVFTHTVWHYSNLYRYLFIVYYILHLLVLTHILYNILNTRLLCAYTHCVTFYLHILCCTLCTQIVSHLVVCCRAECCVFILLGLCARETGYTLDVANFLCTLGLCEAKGDYRTEVFCSSNDLCGSTQLGQVNTAWPETCTGVGRGPTVQCMFVFVINHFDIEHFVSWGRFGARSRSCGKWLLSPACLPSVWNISTATGRNFVKFYNGGWGGGLIIHSFIY